MKRASLMATVIILTLMFSISGAWAKGPPPNDSLAAQVAALAAYVVELQDKVAALESKLQYMTVQTETLYGLAGPHVIFTGVNVHIRNGLGATEHTINGKGNLIVGYNENYEQPYSRIGSHNLVVGPYHGYSSFSGFVTGRGSRISGMGSSISGGIYNIASGDYASVSGGLQNQATNGCSSVSGGQYNIASANYSSVSGGYNRSATDALDWAAGLLYQDQ